MLWGYAIIVAIVALYLIAGFAWASVRVIVGWPHEPKLLVIGQAVFLFFLWPLTMVRSAKEDD